MAGSAPTFADAAREGVPSAIAGPPATAVVARSLARPLRGSDVVTPGTSTAGLVLDVVEVSDSCVFVFVFDEGEAGPFFDLSLDGVSLVGGVVPSLVVGGVVVSPVVGGVVVGGVVVSLVVGGVVVVSLVVGGVVVEVLGVPVPGLPEVMVPSFVADVPGLGSEVQ